MDQADFQDSVLEPFQTIPLDKEEDDSEEEIDLKTVLIIDDNSEIRNYLKEHLKDKYRIVEAENGSEGLKLAQGELPDIVICDVMMPKMDGFEVCTELKSNVETDFIPVILLTAKAEREDKLEGLEFGADDYILKPFDIDELMLRMKNLIASRKILMEKYTSKHYQLEVSNIEVQSEDQLFLDNLKSAIEEHLADEDFGVEELAEKMSINRVTLHNKLKKLIDKSPSEVIKEFRLEQAQQLLQKDAGNISEVAYSVGFKSISHFSRAFKKRYNITPNKFKVNATK
jgi:DNA-binding response OmpR family regulator